MKKKYLAILLLPVILFFSFREDNNDAYIAHYHSRLTNFQQTLSTLKATISKAAITDTIALQAIRSQIQIARNSMKQNDFWFRYLEPTVYKSVNWPLPVEWETEVFEKFEKPYKRDGAGLTLAALYLDEENISKDTLLSLITASEVAMNTYLADSITKELKTYHHFYLANRLYLLNLAAIYTTGFECPNTEQIIPELRLMLAAERETYTLFNESYPSTPITAAYISQYDKLIAFVNAQPDDYTAFDHFSFIKDYVNPLYALNQQMVLDYKVVSHSLVDYTLNKNATSIFDKNLYYGQNPKGIFHRLKDEEVLAEIEHLGKLLFYDPILSGNNERSCASCHKPKQFFADTAVNTALQFNKTERLTRNAPSLVNAEYNHLIMADGIHTSLLNQTKNVITNPIEMGSEQETIVKKVLSCKEYKKAFTALLQYTPADPEISFDHIASAITLYYCKFSKYYAPFDVAVNEQKYLEPAAKEGFNLFMSKAQCGTCHFVPQFNGVKPPYIGSEFEVLGVPTDGSYTALDKDEGRYIANAAKETLHAFRTGTVRNAAKTMPYMHNGIFHNLREVVDFYDGGGGAGRGLVVDNQTLSADSLHLTNDEKDKLIRFMESLTENVQFENPPAALPASRISALNKRKPGGSY